MFLPVCVFSLIRLVVMKFVQTRAPKLTRSRIHTYIFLTLDRYYHHHYDHYITISPRALGLTGKARSQSPPPPSLALQSSSSSSGSSSSSSSSSSSRNSSISSSSSSSSGTSVPTKEEEEEEEEYEEEDDDDERVFAPFPTPGFGGVSDIPPI